MDEPSSRTYLSRAVHFRIGHTSGMSDHPIRTNLARLLKEKGRSARSVSLAAGLSESAIKHILGGRSEKPGYQNIKAIADVLGVSVGDITGSPVSAPPPLVSQPGEFIEDQTILQLIGYWRILDPGERGYLLGLIRKSALGR